MCNAIPCEKHFQTYNEFWEYFRGNISVLGYPSIEALSTAGNAYDAVWAAALALDSVDRQLRGGALPGMTSLLNYNYSNSEINNLIFNAAKDRVFIGVTVSFAFVYLLV